MLGGEGVGRSGAVLGWWVLCALAGSSPSPVERLAERWQKLLLPHAPQPREEGAGLLDGF